MSDKQMKLDQALFDEAAVVLNKITTNEVQVVFDELARQVTTHDDNNEILQQVLDESIKFQTVYNDTYAPQYTKALALLGEFGDVAAALKRRNIVTDQGSANSVDVGKMQGRSRLN